jgi:hypothetical protein
MTEMSTTRGLPFEPSQASQARAELARKAEEERKQNLRDYARRLDQEERCYKQHRVPQLQDWR